MDPSVVALIATSANLQRSRLYSVDAKIFADNLPLGKMSGGILTAETTVQLADSDNSDEVVSSITVKIEGFPKGITQENVDPKHRVFCVEVTFQGVYSWNKKPPAKVISDPALAHALGRPMYALAVSEARAVAEKMGFIGIKTDPDLPRPSAKNSGPIKSPKRLHSLPPDADDVADKLATKAKKVRPATAK